MLDLIPCSVGRLPLLSKGNQGATRPANKRKIEMKVEFKTTRGANVVLTAHASGVDAEVNGKTHTHDGATFGHDAEIGPHVILAGRVKAVIAPEYISVVSEFFAAAPAYIAAALEKISAEYKGSRQEFSDQMAHRMYSKNSDH